MASTIVLSPDLEADPEVDTDRKITLCETLDRVLNKGVVLAGEIIISVADVDLVYLNVQVLLSSLDTAYRARLDPDRPPSAGPLTWSSEQP